MLAVNLFPPRLMELSKSDVALMMMSGKNSFKMLGHESLVVGYTHNLV